MNTIRRSLVLLALGGCAFILSDAILVMFISRSDPENEGNPISKLILAIGYVAVAMTLVPYFRETLFVLRRNWSLSVLVLLAFASSLWAETPAFVFQRSIAVLGTTLFGIALAVRLSAEEQLRLMRWLFRTLAVLSLLCVLFFPAYGISHLVEGQGEWQGVFEYKNYLGATMALAILMEWHLPADTRFSKFARWFFMLLSGVLLVFSQSVTPLVALIGALSLIEIYKFANHRLRIPLYAIVTAILLIAVSVATVLSVRAGSATDILGRSSDLTGRKEIWRMVLSFVSQRPVLGYGQSGFWYGASAGSFAVDKAMGFRIMYSHNGFLEILLNLGAVGLFLALVFLGTGLKRAYDCSERDRSSMGLWPLAYFLFLIFHNLGECTILMQDLQWAICVSIVVGNDAALIVRDEEQEEEESLFVPIDEATCALPQNSN